MSSFLSLSLSLSPARIFIVSNTSLRLKRFQVVFCKVFVRPRFCQTRQIMPPKRKLASNTNKDPEVGASTVSTKNVKRGRAGRSADRQMSLTKYGTSTRVLRSQSTDPKGKQLASSIAKKKVEKPPRAPKEMETTDPRDKKVEEHSEQFAPIVKSRGKGNKKADKENLEIHPTNADHEEFNDEQAAPVRARGKGATKKADVVDASRPGNEANVDISAVPKDGGHDELKSEQSPPVTKTRGKGAKKKDAAEQHGDAGNGQMKSDPGDEGHEDFDCEQSAPVRKPRGKGANNKKREVHFTPPAAEAAEETNGSNGSGAPKEESKRGRKGKPNASKTEPEPDEKKAKLDEEPENYDCEKTNKKGEKWNLKIATWNVASLRACVKKGMLDYVAKEDADIICFQETKCSEQKAPAEAKVEGYHTYWCSGSKNDGYAGVALFTKEKPLNVNYGIGDEEYDVEGRIITAEYDKFYLVTTYVPNSGQGLKTLPKRMKWDELFLSHLKELDGKKPVVVCGDLNVAHQEIDLKNPKTNTKNAGFTPEERANMTELLAEGFVDSFRHLYPDKTGAYTFWTYLGNARSKNTGWRLDYFVLSERLMESVCDVVIRSQVLGSDHCPTTMFIHI